MDKPVFSERAGRNAAPPLTLEGLQIAVRAAYTKFDERDYFQAAFGKNCPDDAVPGDQGVSVTEALRLRFGARDLDVTSKRIREMSGDDLFDLIEFLYPYAARPTKTSIHNYYGCGVHVIEADYPAGAAEWREEVNAHLARIDPPFRLTERGEIETTPTDSGLQLLVDEVPRAGDAENVDERVQRAIAKFFARHATKGDRREAIRILADVLEFLKKDMLKQLNEKDSSDLFQIANRFAIRHHDGKQVTGYSEAFYPWIFQVYLATVTLVIRLKAETAPNP